MQNKFTISAVYEDTFEMDVVIDGMIYRVKTPRQGETVEQCVSAQVPVYDKFPPVGYSGELLPYGSIYVDGKNNWSSNLNTFRYEALKSLVRIAMEEIEDEKV